MPLSQMYHLSHSVIWHSLILALLTIMHKVIHNYSETKVDHGHRCEMRTDSIPLHIF